MKKDIYKQPVLMNLAYFLSVPQSWSFSEAQPASARPVFLSVAFGIPLCDYDYTNYYQNDRYQIVLEIETDK